ncbi:ATP/GTP-binding protein [Streptomyces sp. PTM05]|uniref:ATP/GTP-binding protein n=1 Tax=Streptantibioticus parmotrematis TaxID=2873249 RepID=A0ABS7R3Q5_9ACTN|nr:ATP/GTP-binding protein [Streptantibioticus parmotrematis]MBY8888674.1 ATP/GTP-binding protein [Streptantibioticus parmotrematis]
MSPRRNRPHRAVKPEPSRDGERHGLERTESWHGEEWVMRPVSGSAGKTYRCPGCDQEIPPGVGHVVAWPEHAGVDDRRHWHRACWNARERRGAKVLRSRNAPRH